MLEYVWSAGGFGCRGVQKTNYIRNVISSLKEGHWIVRGPMFPLIEAF
jgi:hypothetical protein